MFIHLVFFEQLLIAVLNKIDTFHSLCLVARNKNSILTSLKQMVFIYSRECQSKGEIAFRKAKNCPPLSPSLGSIFLCGIFTLRHVPSMCRQRWLPVSLTASNSKKKKASFFPAFMEILKKDSD